MRIALISPLIESVPPRYYGGTERVVSYLAEELVALGHDVTLFASGDSVTSARLVPCAQQGLRLDETVVEWQAHYTIMLDRVFAMADEFDVLHFNIDYLHFPLLARYPHPSITTHHGRLDLADLQAVYRQFPDMPVTSISHSQRAPLPWLNWRGNVYHGLPRDAYAFQSAAGEYLAFLGRTSPEKGLDAAIEIARRARLPLKIAAKVDRLDREYFEGEIRRLLDDPLVDFIGEIGEAEKEEFLGRAIALLCPIRWPEPFGLVLIEAMACGTPVVAFPRGAAPEIIDEGVSGLLVTDVDSAVAAVEHAKSMPRARVREAFEKRFTTRRMAEDYLLLYQDAVGRSAERVLAAR